MNLQDYIEQIKGWIGSQCFLYDTIELRFLYFYTGFSNDSSWHFLSSRRGTHQYYFSSIRGYY